MTQEVKATNARTPDLASRAQAADTYWAPRISVIDAGGLGSFRGLYTVLFRNHSGLVHATFGGLNRVVEDVGPTRRRIRLDLIHECRGPYGLATVVYGLGLYVVEPALGWPDGRAVTETFEHFPAA